MSIYDKYPGSMKIDAHLYHIIVKQHLVQFCRLSNRWTYWIFIINTRRDSNIQRPYASTSSTKPPHCQTPSPQCQTPSSLCQTLTHHCQSGDTTPCRMTGVNLPCHVRSSYTGLCPHSQSRSTHCQTFSSHYQPLSRFCRSLECFFLGMM